MLGRSVNTLVAIGAISVCMVAIAVADQNSLPSNLVQAMYAQQKRVQSNYAEYYARHGSAPATAADFTEPHVDAPLSGVTLRTVLSGSTLSVESIVDGKQFRIQRSITNLDPLYRTVKYGACEVRGIDPNELPMTCTAVE